MKKTEKDHLNTSKNPFVFGLKIPVRMFRKKHESAVSTDKNILHRYEVSTTVQSVVIEQLPITKVFTPFEYREYISMLSKDAKCLMLWLLYELTPGQDWFQLNRKRYVDETKLSYVDLNNSVTHLCNAAVICPTTIKDCYWINPSFFFAGDRISKYPDNLVGDNQI